MLVLKVTITYHSLLVNPRSQTFFLNQSFLSAICPVDPATPSLRWNPHPHPWRTATLSVYHHIIIIASARMRRGKRKGSERGVKVFSRSWVFLPISPQGRRITDIWRLLHITYYYVLLDKRKNYPRCHTIMLVAYHCHDYMMNAINF